MRTLSLAALILLLLGAPAFAEADGGGRTVKHKLTQSPTYIEIEPIYTTVLDTERPVGLLMIGVGLDVPDAKLRGEAWHALPVLRDAFVRNLTNFSAIAVRPWKQPDVGEIAARLQRVTDRVLGRRGARLLLAQVALRLSK